MMFSNNVSYMVKILTFYMNRSVDFDISTARSLLNPIRYLCGLEIKKTTIKNKVRAIKQIFVLNPL